jgi:dihydroorotate dehydrogenase (fumarate)
MIDLSTTYLGLKLAHPLVVGASPIGEDLDLARRAEDAGAAALIMPSLFEEQLRREQATFDAIGEHEESFAEAGSYLPPPSDYVLGPDAYLQQIRKLKGALQIPVIASLNGVTPSGWTEHARLIEAAGADALELNLYSPAPDPMMSGAQIEERMLEVVRAVTAATTLPVAVKLSPFFSSLGHFAHSLETAGAKGLVMFNRFYQPDLDLEALDVALSLHLSNSDELLLRLRWLALLFARTKLSLAASGGVHTGIDALKAVMAGADAVQTVSSLLKHGPGYMSVLKKEAEEWLEQHEYESLAQARGSLSLLRCPRPEEYERGNYVKILQGYAQLTLSIPR